LEIISNAKDPDNVSISFSSSYKQSVVLTFERFPAGGYTHSIQGANIFKSLMINEQCDKINILHSFLRPPHMPTVYSHMGEEK